MLHHAAKQSYVHKLESGISSILTTIDESHQLYPRQAWMNANDDPTGHETTPYSSKPLLPFRKVLSKVLFDFRGFLLMK